MYCDPLTGEFSRQSQSSEFEKRWNGELRKAVSKIININQLWLFWLTACDGAGQLLQFEYNTGVRVLALSQHPLTGEMCYNGTALTVLECLLRHEEVQAVFRAILEEGLDKCAPKLRLEDVQSIAKRVMTGIDLLSCSIADADQWKLDMLQV